MNHPELIVMLTYDDRTVENAYEIFDTCKNTKAKYWGIKETGLPFDRMKLLFSYIKKYAKTAVLEVVAYTEKECLEGARMAAECGCDILMGTLYFDSVNDFCKQNKIKYMPFVGKVSGRPSVLDGSMDNIVAEAKSYLKKGIYGFDLLGYRYSANAAELNKRFVSQIDLPVCIAGGINCFKKLDEIKAVSPWAFTVGSAFFDNKFGDSFCEQIDTVYNYINAI